MGPDVAHSGGPDRAGRTPFSWLLVATVVTVASALQKLPCLRGRVDTDVLATAQCYSDVPLFYIGRGLAADFGWFGHLAPGFRDLEYPPLINLFIEASAKLTHVVLGLPADELRRRSSLSAAELYDLPGMAGEERVFFLVTCTGLLVAVLATVWIVWRAGWVIGDRTSWLMVTPIVVLTLTLNWDAVAVLATAGALLAWQRRRMGWFGGLVAVGTAAKLFPLVMLAAGVILAAKTVSLQATARVVRMVVAFGLVVAAANAPLYLSDRDGWLEFWTTNTERGVSFGSAWLALRMVGLPTTADQLSLALALGMALAWVACAAATWSGWMTPTLAELSVVFLLIFFALGKVYSPQYSLWVVLGLLLVTRSRWLIGAVAAAETVHYVTTWLYIRGVTTPETGLDKTYWFSIVARLAVEGVVVLYVLHRARSRAVRGDSPSLDQVTVVP